MGCFLGCFGGSKDRRRRKQRNKVIPRDHKHGGQKPLQDSISPEQGVTERPSIQVSELRETTEGQSSSSSRKRVTFNSNVKTYEHVYESTDSLQENEGGTEKAKEEILVNSTQSHSLSEDDSTTSSVGSYPPNHRYQNCRDSDDEEAEELEYGDSDLGDDDDGDEEVDEEGYGDYDEEMDDGIVKTGIWSEAIPTSSMESCTEKFSAREITEEVDSARTTSSLSQIEVTPIGLNQNARRDRSLYVHPVLNPVENISQWKAVKSKSTPSTPSLKPQKENHIIEMGSDFKQSSFSFIKSKTADQAKTPSQEIRVDASLSNWLASSETTPPTKKVNFTESETTASDQNMSQGLNSLMSLEDRPILGALTVEELRQFSASPSPRRSPSRSPDEMPIIGTVGTYWSHSGPETDSGSTSSYKGIPNTTSKYREDKKVNWYSTPFETRLERALNRNAAEA